MTNSQPASSLASAPGLAKEFRCSYCTKSFSRAEHLHRHQLNHDGTGTTCARCSAVFKRKDLLDRHMLRHKEKDDEAGGEGLGKLLTRKRLWRDSNGMIVADRRPEHEEKKRKRTSQDTISSKKQAAPMKSNSPTARDARLPLSPPTSDPTVSADDPWPVLIDDILPLEDIVIDSFDFLYNGSWATRPFQSRQGAANTEFNDGLFAQDTASSFDHPFTTMEYYNWLFGNDPWTAGLDSLSSQLYAHPTRPAPHVSNIGSLLSGHDHAHQAGLLQQHDMPHKTAISSWSSDFSSSSLENHDQAVSKSAELLLMLQSGQSHPPRYTSDVRDGSISDDSTTKSYGFASTSTHYLPTPIGTSSNQEYVTSNHGPYIKNRKLPIIDEAAREVVLSLINLAHPKSLEGTEITRDHSLLTVDVLQQWSDLFFSRFNVSYPLLHRPTFDPAQTEALLLTAVLLLGATYSNKDHHLFSICIHNVMRTQILGSAAFTTRPPLWILQTILLVECFGKSRAGQSQHDMSHLFHSLLTNLIRRSDCQSAHCRVSSEGEADPDTVWRTEVVAEQKRRLALLSFMWDTQHAVLFSQSLCMNSRELRLSLPWDPALWEADTAEEWSSASSKVQLPPSFLSVLRSYINPEPLFRTPKLNGLSRVFMLHGLISVAWDLKQRDQTTGVAITGSSEFWKSRIARSYKTWKSDFDNYSEETFLSLDEGSPERDAFQKFCTANLAIYHVAHIILHVEIIDLQIYAGASHLTGRPVTNADQARARQQIERWAGKGSIAGAKAVSHAARILRDGIMKLNGWDVDDVFHYPWCLYIATLTCWAFQVTSRESSDNGDNSDDEDAEDWDSKAEMNALVSAMTRSNLEDLWRVAGKYRTTDIPRVIAHHLASIRWAVVQEGMIVLRGLVERGSRS